MVSQNIRIYNQLLGALSIDDTDRMINIKEHGTADTNFIITHLIKQILQEQNRICFIMLHNNTEHYQAVAKRLGYDIVNNIKANKIRAFEPFSSLFEHVGEESFMEKMNSLNQLLYANINEALESLLTNFEGVVYIIVDDVSHLLDIGFDVKKILSFLNYCVNTVSDKVKLIVNSHICCTKDTVISNYMNYVCDVNVEVLPLTTGKSADVSGTLNIQRFKNNNNSKCSQYHFKVFDRGVKIFSLGDSVYNLYK